MRVRDQDLGALFGEIAPHEECRPLSEGHSAKRNEYCSDHTEAADESERLRQHDRQEEERQRKATITQHTRARFRRRSLALTHCGHIAHSARRTDFLAPPFRRVPPRDPSGCGLKSSFWTGSKSDDRTGATRRSTSGSPCFAHTGGAGSTSSNNVGCSFRTISFGASNGAAWRIAKLTVTRSSPMPPLSQRRWTNREQATHHRTVREFYTSKVKPRAQFVRRLRPNSPSKHGR